MGSKERHILPITKKDQEFREKEKLDYWRL